MLMSQLASGSLKYGPGNTLTLWLLDVYNLTFLKYVLVNDSYIDVIII